MELLTKTGTKGQNRSESIEHSNWPIFSVLYDNSDIVEQLHCIASYHDRASKGVAYICSSMQESIVPISIDLLTRKETHFLLWRPGATDVSPTIFIGLSTDAGAVTANFREIALQPSAAFPELWEVAAASCGLVDGIDTLPTRQLSLRLRHLKSGEILAQS
jgi:hypothetical protein